MESESFSKLRSKDVVPYQNTSNTYSWPDTDASDSCPDPFGTCFSTSSPHVLPPLDFDDTLSYAPFVTENIVLMRTSDMLRTPTPYNSRNIEVMGLCLSAASPVLSIEDPWYQPSSPSSVLAASFSNDPLHPHQHIKPTSHASFHTTTADAERERSHADSDTETDTDTDTDSTATSTHTHTKRAGGKRIRKNMRKRAAPRTESKSHSKPGTSGTTNCTHVQVKANISYDNESSSFERDVICQLSRVWSESTLMQLDVGIGDIGSFLLSSIPASLTGRVVHLSALTEEEQCTPLEIRTFTRSGVMHTGTASHCGDSCDHACAPTSPPYLGSLRKGLREECHTRHRRTYSYMASKSGVRQISTLHAHSRHGEVTGNSNVRKAGREMLSDGYISAGHAIVSRFSFLQTVMGLGIGRGHGQGIGFPSWCLQLNDITVGALTSVSSSTPSPSLSSPSLSSPEPNSISSIDPFLHYTYPQLRTVPPSHISCPASSAHSPASSISYHAAEGHQHVYCEDHHDQECFGDPPSHHHRHTEHMFADEPFFQAQPLPLPPPPPPPIMKSLRISGLMPPFLFGLSGWALNPSISLHFQHGLSYWSSQSLLIHHQQQRHLEAQQQFEDYCHFLSLPPSSPVASSNSSPSLSSQCLSSSSICSPSTSAGPGADYGPVFSAHEKKEREFYYLLPPHMPSADTGHASGSKESRNIACVCQSCVQLRNLQSLYSSSAYSVNPLLPASSPPSSFCSRLSMFLGSLYVRTHCTLKYDMSLSVGGRAELNLPYFLQRWCVSIYQGHGHHHSHHRHSQPHSVSHAYDDGSSNDRDCAEDADHSNYEEQGGSVNGNIHHLFHFVNPALRSLSLGLRLLQRSAERLGRILLEHSFLSFSFLVSLFSVQKVYLEAAVSPFAILESLPFSSPSSSINNAENNTEYKSPSSPSSNVADGNVVEVDSVYHARGAVLQPCEGSSAPRYAPGSSRIPSYIEKMYSTFAPTVPSFSSSDISKPSPPPPPPLPTNLLGPDLQSLSPRAPPSHPRTHSVLEALSSYLLQQDEHGGFAYSEIGIGLALSRMGNHSLECGFRMTALGLAFKLSYCVANHEDRNVHMQKDPLGENKANNDTEAGVDSKAERDGECDWGCDERARRRRKREERNQERKNMLARELLRTQLFGRTQKFSLPLIFVDYPYQLLQALVHKSRATGGGADRMGSSSTALTGSFPSAPLHTHNVQDNNNIPGRACTGAGVLPLGREGGVGDCDGSASSGLAVADVLVKERDSEVRALKRMASNLLLSLSLYICVNIVPLLYHRLSRQWQTELKNQRQEKTRVARRRMRREGDGGLNYAEYDMGTEGTRLSLQSRLTAQMHACLTAVSVRRRACLAYSSHCMSFLTNELISCSSHAGGLVSSLFHSRTSSSPSLPLSAASSGPAHDTGSEGAYIEHKFRKALFLRSVALAIQQEMLASAKVCRERMLRKKGVLVRRALYGYSVDSVHSSSSAKLGLIDVSVSLQVLVRLDGSLVLPHGVSKRGMLGFYDPKVDIDIAIENELAAIRALRITENGETRQPSEGENIQACATERNLIRRHQYLNMLHLLRRQPLQLYLQYCFGGAEKNGAGVATVCTVLLQDSEGVAISH